MKLLLWISGSYNILLRPFLKLECSLIHVHSLRMQRDQTEIHDLAMGNGDSTAEPEADV